MEKLRRMLGIGALIGMLSLPFIWKEKPNNIRKIETNRGNYTVREFDDRYEAHYTNLGSPIRKMYDHGKDGKLDKLGVGPKGLATMPGTSNSPDETHKEIYREIFSKLS